MAKINGKYVEILKNTTVLQYITDKGFDPKLIAVECNGDIVPKKKYSEKIINADDIIEIVSFVGGG